MAYNDKLSEYPILPSSIIETNLTQKLFDLIKELKQIILDERNIINLLGWRKVKTIEVTAATSSITIDGLDGNKDVMYKIITRIRNISGVGMTYILRPNNDTSANYGFQFVAGESTLVSAGRSTAFIGLWIGYAEHTQLSFGESLLFAKSGYERICLTNAADRISGTAITRAIYIPSVWNNTTANITSIVITGTEVNGLGPGSYIEIFAKVV